MIYTSVRVSHCHILKKKQKKKFQTFMILRKSCEDFLHAFAKNTFCLERLQYDWQTIV